MKLIVCLECSDVTALRNIPKTCVCGKSGGYYDERTNRSVVVYGPCEVIGMDNNTFYSAIRAVRNGLGGPSEMVRRVTTWVFGHDYDQITRQPEDAS